MRYMKHFTGAAATAVTRAEVVWLELYIRIANRLSWYDNELCTYVTVATVTVNLFKQVWCVPYRAHTYVVLLLMMMITWAGDIT